MPLAFLPSEPSHFAFPALHKISPLILKDHLFLSSLLEPHKNNYFKNAGRGTKLQGLPGARGEGEGHGGRQHRSAGWGRGSPLQVEKGREKGQGKEAKATLGCALSEASRFKARHGARSHGDPTMQELIAEEVRAAQACLTLRPHGLQPARLLCPRSLQARPLEWAAFSRGSSQPRNQTQVSRVAGRFFTS